MLYNLYFLSEIIWRIRCFKDGNEWLRFCVRKEEWKRMLRMILVSFSMVRILDEGLWLGQEKVSGIDIIFGVGGVLKEEVEQEWEEVCKDGFRGLLFQYLEVRILLYKEFL